MKGTRRQGRRLAAETAQTLACPTQDIAKLRRSATKDAEERLQVKQMLAEIVLRLRTMEGELNKAAGPVCRLRRARWMMRSTSEDSPDMLVRKTKYRVWGG
jgi:hypothetical protein